MEMMSSSWRDLTLVMRITCEHKKYTTGASMTDMAAHAITSWAKKCGKLSDAPVGNSGTARKTKDSGRNETVAAPELQRIQEPSTRFF